MESLKLAENIYCYDSLATNQFDEDMTKNSCNKSSLCLTISSLRFTEQWNEGTTVVRTEWPREKDDVAGAMSNSTPFFESGTGLLTVGLGVCLLGLVVFCCIDVFWLKKELRPKHDHWTHLGNKPNNTSRVIADL